MSHAVVYHFIEIPSQPCALQPHLSCILFDKNGVVDNTLIMYLCVCVYIHECAYICVSNHMYGGQMLMCGISLVALSLPFTGPVRLASQWVSSVSTSAHQHWDFRRESIAFHLDAGIQMQALKLPQQVSYQPNHLPSSKNVYLEVWLHVTYVEGFFHVWAL